MVSIAASKYYRVTILASNAISIIDFFYSLVLSFIPFENNILKFKVLTISLSIGVFFSGICFGDFFSLQVINYEKYKNNKKLMKKAFKYKYWTSFMRYVGTNYAIGLSGIVLNTIYDTNSEQFYMEGTPIGVKYWVLISLIIAIVLFLIAPGMLEAIWSKISSKMDVKNKSNSWAFVTPLPFLIVGGGEDLLTYLILILWIVIIVIPTIRKEKLSKTVWKSLWENKNLMSREFINSFNEAKTVKEIVLKSYPFMLLPFIFSYIMNSRFNICIQTLMIVNMITIYYSIRGLKEKNKRSMPFVVEVIFLGISMLIYILFLNTQTVSLLKPKKLFAIGNYAIQNYTVAVTIIGIILYAVVVILSVTFLKIKEKKESKIFISILLNDTTFFVIPTISIAYLLIQKNSINLRGYWYVISILSIILFSLLSLIAGAKHNVKKLSKFYEGEYLNITEVLSKGYYRTSPTAFICKCIIKGAYTKNKT